MTRDLGVRLAPENIWVNVVCPGFIQTPLTAGLAESPEVYELLARRHPWGDLDGRRKLRVSFVTAAVWTVDGGYTSS